MIFLRARYKVLRRAVLKLEKDVKQSVVHSEALDRDFFTKISHCQEALDHLVRKLGREMQENAFSAPPMASYEKFVESLSAPNFFQRRKKIFEQIHELHAQLIELENNAKDDFFGIVATPNLMRRSLRYLFIQHFGKMLLLAAILLIVEVGACLIFFFFFPHASLVAAFTHALAIHAVLFVAKVMATLVAMYVGALMVTTGIGSAAVVKTVKNGGGHLHLTADESAITSSVAGVIRPELTDIEKPPPLPAKINISETEDEDFTVFFKHRFFAHGKPNDFVERFTAIMLKVLTQANLAGATPEMRKQCTSFAEKLAAWVVDERLKIFLENEEDRVSVAKAGVEIDAQKRAFASALENISASVSPA